MNIIKPVKAPKGNFNFDVNSSKCLAPSNDGVDINATTAIETISTLEGINPLDIIKINHLDSAEGVTYSSDEIVELISSGKVPIMGMNTFVNSNGETVVYNDTQEHIINSGAIKYWQDGSGEFKVCEVGDYVYFFEVQLDGSVVCLGTTEKKYWDASISSHSSDIELSNIAVEYQKAKDLIANSQNILNNGLYNSPEEKAMYEKIINDNKSIVYDLEKKYSFEELQVNSSSNGETGMDSSNGSLAVPVSKNNIIADEGMSGGQNYLTDDVNSKNNVESSSSATSMTKNNIIANEGMSGGQNYRSFSNEGMQSSNDYNLVSSGEVSSKIALLKERRDSLESMIASDKDIINDYELSNPARKNWESSIKSKEAEVAELNEQISYWEQPNDLRYPEIQSMSMEELQVEIDNMNDIIGNSTGDPEGTLKIRRDAYMEELAKRS